MTVSFRTLIVTLVAVTSTVLAATGTASVTGYLSEIEAYREAREDRLRRPDGWLALVGLFWLEPGPNSFGSDTSLEIVLPPASCPPRAGVFLLGDDGAVRVVPEPGVELSLDGGAIPSRPLRDDTSDEADVLELGRLRMHLIRRGDRVGLRVKDPESPTRTAFEGLDYFPVDSALRVVARFERLAEPEAVEIPTVAGTTSEMWIPGRLRFEIGGKTYALDPLVPSPGVTELFIIFRDETSGRETYGAGRYLYATLDGETAVLDFNKAYNPPCAFTRFATCPLPLRSNRLPVAIRAGEKSSGTH